MEARLGKALRWRPNWPGWSLDDCRHVISASGALRSGSKGHVITDCLTNARDISGVTDTVFYKVSIIFLYCLSFLVYSWNSMTAYSRSSLLIWRSCSSFKRCNWLIDIIYGINKKAKYIVYIFDQHKSWFIQTFVQSPLSYYILSLYFYHWLITYRAIVKNNYFNK